MLRCVRYDIIYALRMLRKYKSFSAIAILTLALGIGANTAIFSVVNGVLLRPLPYRDPGRLALFRLDLGADKAVNSFSFPEIRDFQTEAHSFEQVAAFTTFNGALMGTGERTLVVSAGFATANLFATLGVHPMMGRDFLPEENHRPSNVAILSYECWQREFGADLGIIGKSFDFGRSTQVIGVLPLGFQIPPLRTFRDGNRSVPQADIWMPTQFGNIRSQHFMRVVGRLKPGVSFGQVQSEVDALAARLNEQYADYRPDGIRFYIEPLQGDIVHTVRPAIVALAASVGFVLLIACANVASLLIARSRSRQREIAVRAAIGASKTALMRQVLVESSVLATIAGCIGVGLAFEGVRLLKLLKPANLPRLDDVSIDVTVLIVSAVVSIGIGLLFGLLPALQATRLNLAEVLRGGTRSSQSVGGSPAMRFLVIGEVAMCLTLLICSGLMIRTFELLQRADPGFDVSNRLLFQAYLAFHEGQTPVERQQHFDELRQRVALLPGVQAVGATSILPFSGLILTGPFAYDSSTISHWGGLTADYLAITPGYFEAIGAHLRGGRFFDEHDGVVSQQVIVDDNLARAAWPGRNAVGQKLWVISSFDGLNHVQVDVVGVVQHIRDDHLDSEGRPQVYLPSAEALRENIGQATSFCVRTAGDPTPLVPVIRQVAADLHRSAPVAAFERLDDRVFQALAGTRFELTLMSVFAGIAVVLALVGLYGVISFLVSERWREMGIRIALGASAGDVRWLVLTQGLGITGIGVVLGLAASFLVTPLFRSLLYGVKPTDPATFALLSMFMVLISAIACYVPARRATRVDPVEAMRAE